MGRFFQSNNHSLKKLTEETLTYSNELSVEGVTLATELSLQSAIDDKKKLTAEIRKQKNAAKKNKGNEKELKALEKALEAVRVLMDTLYGRRLTKAERAAFKQHHFEERLHYIVDALVVYNQQRQKLQMMHHNESYSADDIYQALVKYIALMHHDFIERARLVNFLHKGLANQQDAPYQLSEFRRQVEVFNKKTDAARQDLAWMAFLAKVNNIRLEPEKPVVQQKTGFAAQGILARQLEQLRKMHNRHSTFKPTMKR